ncbi:EAL domain-containing protein [Paenibacillus sp. NPDC058071]|uniref:bifunctional diguanylate cyclase/phosphodiesterase n=1 Tax=Paenibacillus sp. NPDC058071 TaxID=3346326 RepID=UPI0036DECF65
MRSIKLSIAQKVITALGALMLLSFASLMTVHFMKLYDASIKQGELLAQKQSISYIGHFTQSMNQTLSMLETMRSTTLQMRADGVQTRERTVKLLEDIVHKNTYLLGAFTLWEPDAFDGEDTSHRSDGSYDDETGRFLPYVVRTNSGMIQIEPLKHYEEAGIGDYYQIPKQTKRFTLLEPYTYEIDGQSIMMTSLVYPILDDNGEFLGIIGADISLATVQRGVERLKPLGGYANIITESNNYIVNSLKPELAAKPYEQWPNGAAPGDLRDKEELMLYTDDPSNSETVMQLFYSIPINDYKWYFEMIIPKENMLVDFRESVLRSIVISLLALAASVILMVLLLRRIVLQNIEKVAKASTAIAMGNSRQRLEIRTNDEFEHLADQFNRMLDYRIEAEALIHFQATHDLLTALPNRFGFNQFFDRLIEEADTPAIARHMALLYIDLDRFKVINDTMDYSIGDELLKQIARRIESVVGSSGQAFRFGGDEFVVLLDGVIHLPQVLVMAEDVLRSVAEPILLKDRMFYVTASIGISLQHEISAATSDRLVKESDIALFVAKKQRNTCTMYTHSMNDVPTKEIVLENSLYAALENNQFMLVYQPKIELLTGRIYGAEALIRWKHPELGMVSPLEFIPLAEKTGFIIPLGEWVLKTACEQIKKWEKLGITSFSVSVNMSMIQFQQKNIVYTIERILSETGVSPKQLELELTESIFMDNPEHTLKILNDLQQLGVRLSLDDFGTGYSSLSYLQNIPLHYLKLDKTFIHDIVSDIRKQMIFHSLVVIAHNLNMKVVTEGVETQEELDIIREHDCDLVQGYFYSPPVPPDKFAELYEAVAGTE